MTKKIKELYNLISYFNREFAFFADALVMDFGKTKLGSLQILKSRKEICPQ